MNPKFINPYSALGKQHKDSLDYIIANLPLNPTFDDLNDQLAASLFTPDPQNPKLGDLLSGFIKTVLPNAYNGYVNTQLSVVGCELSANTGNRQLITDNCYWRYNQNQVRLISQMLNGINNIPVESIGDYLSGMEENIVSGGLSYEEQAPLLIAAQTGKTDHEYWMAQIATPGTWAAYLNADTAINYMHLAGWVNAAMQGALLTYGLIKPPQIQVLDIFSSAIGSTGLAAGKVVFGWVPRTG